MNQRERNSLDRYITGNYGEDQFRNHDPSKEEEPMNLDKEFQGWWLHTGQRVAIKILSSIDQLEAIRLLCRIAYCQGRIDEGLKLEGQLEAIRRAT